jgi:hypothetical protein
VTDIYYYYCRYITEFSGKHPGFKFEMTVTLLSYIAYIRGLLGKLLPFIFGN